MKLNKIYFVLFLSILALVACQSETNRKAKRLQLPDNKINVSKVAFNPFQSGITCDSLKIRAISASNFIKQIIVSAGSVDLDTVKLAASGIPAGAENDYFVSDYNFDGFCEFVIPDKKSAVNGGMNYNYFLFDTLSHNYIEINSLPKFIGNFKLDVKNQRVKIYCPNETCFAYYKFENNTFSQVQGEFKK